MTEAYHSEERRREIFLAPVEAQDHEMPVDLSRKAIAERFGITEENLEQIEREGLDNDRQPLDRDSDIGPLRCGDWPKMSILYKGAITLPTRPPPAPVSPIRITVECQNDTIATTGRPTI
jgi:hypothetical protein